MTVRNRSLDRTDRRILGLLQKDARLSNKELAAAVGLAPSSCHARVQRLVDDGVVRGFHADVDPVALGIALQAVIYVQLESHGRSSIERFRDRVLEHPEVLDLYHVGGSQDLLVVVAVRDTDHLLQLVTDAFSSQEEVRHIETSILFEHRHSRVLPDLS